MQTQYYCNAVCVSFRPFVTLVGCTQTTIARCCHSFFEESSSEVQTLRRFLLFAFSNLNLNTTLMKNVATSFEKVCFCVDRRFLHFVAPVVNKAIRA